MAEVGDHYRDEEGTYRVVGASDGVTLLRVTDAHGRRVNSGDLRRVADVSGFDPAANPDAGLNPVRTLRNVASGLYWDVRRLL